MTGRSGGRFLFVCLVGCFSPAANAFLPDWSLQIESLEYADHSFHSILVSGGDNTGAALPLEVDVGEIDLAQGVETLGPIRLKLELDFGADDLVVRFPQHDVDSLRFMKPLVPEIAWVTSGQFEGRFSLDGEAASGRRMRLAATFTDVGFDSPDGLFAGLGLSLELSAAFNPDAPSRVLLSGGLRDGELLLYDFYRNFSSGGLAFVGSLDLASGRMLVPEMVLTDDAGLRVALSVQSPSGKDAQAELHVHGLSMEFPQSYDRYLESMAATAGLDGLTTSGQIAWLGDWTPGTLGEGSLTLRSLDVIDGDSGRFALRGLTAELQSDSESTVEWSGASFGRIDLGSGEAVVAIGPEQIELRRAIRIPLFGGAFALSKLRVDAPASEDPVVLVEAEIADVDIGQVTRALDWPEFEGSLSATIPGVNWAQGVMSVEGILEFSVFGGKVLVSDLEVERPFGVLPSLSADMAVADLDLESVTGTFSFGRIAGRLSGYVNELRMLDWEPVAFDAWLGTPSDDKRHDISRQAVSHLTTLGGGSATTMLTSPVLRLFNNFSYRRLGLGCTLSNNVCQIRGIEDQGGGILIMQGAGIPKISILAYNRAVDWPQLVAELSAIASSDSPRVGD